MTFLSPSRHARLNEAVGLLLSLLGLAVLLSLGSYSPADPSWNTATSAGHTHNLLGIFGAQWADFFLQVFGISAYLLPLYLWALAWKWVRSSSIESPWIRALGCLALWFCVSAACGLIPGSVLVGGSLRLSGIVGMIIADYLVAHLNFVGAVIATAAAGVPSPLSCLHIRDVDTHAVASRSNCTMAEVFGKLAGITGSSPGTRD